MPAAPFSSPPLPLQYDDLPPGSDVRREYFGDGGVKIVVPAGEVPAAVARQTLRDAFASAAVVAAPLLLLALVLFLIGLRNNRVAGVYLAWAWAFFAVFCSALMLLVAWLRYGMMTDTIRLGREQMTLLAVTPARLLIETSGPFGVASYEFAADKISRFTVGRDVLLDDRNTPRRLLHLAISLADGRTIRLLPGRDARELAWVCETLGRTMTIAGGRAVT